MKLGDIVEGQWSYVEDKITDFGSIKTRNKFLQGTYCVVNIN